MQHQHHPSKSSQATSDQMHFQKAFRVENERGTSGMRQQGATYTIIPTNTYSPATIPGQPFGLMMM